MATRAMRSDPIVLVQVAFVVCFALLLVIVDDNNLLLGRYPVMVFPRWGRGGRRGEEGVGRSGVRWFVFCGGAGEREWFA